MNQRYQPPAVCRRCQRRGPSQAAVRSNEVATIAAARALQSTYCMAAHCKFLRDQCDDEATMRTIAADPSGATLDATDRAVMDFAARVATDLRDSVRALVDRTTRERDVAGVVLQASGSRAPRATGGLQ